jgi:selenocysteine lyase/cysteine desulfurase
MLRRSFFSKSLKVFIASFFSGTIFSAVSFKASEKYKFNNDWESLRTQFPITKIKAYFNTGTLGPSPTLVVEHVVSKIRNINETGNYKGAEKARIGLADFFGVSEQEICLTHNATEAANIVAMGLALKKGDEIIISSHEHVGHALPWLNRKENDGIVIKVFEPQSSRKENIKVISQLISDRTKVVAIPHVSCTTGTRFPIEELSEILTMKDICFMVDGAQAVGALDIDIKKLGCDFYIASCHKWMLGPKGTGFLYIKKNRLKDIKPIFVGSSSDISWELDENMQSINGWKDEAGRYDYGTQNAAIYEGLEKAITFINEIGIDKIQDRTSMLSTYLIEQLNKKVGNKVRILTPNEQASRSSIVSFVLLSGDYSEMFQLAYKSGFRVRKVPEAGLNAIRVSTHIFNNYVELDSFINFVEEYLNK